jgi:hypothetical protein
LRGYRAPRNPLVLLILLVVGGLLGSAICPVFADKLPILNQGFEPIGMSPTTIDLHVVKITFGLILKLNVGSLIGFLLALIFFFMI